jgi:translation initiation factor IF-1
MFLVETDDGHEIAAHVAGRLRMAFVRLVPGDRVRVQPSPFDGTKGRIVVPEDRIPLRSEP